MLVLTNLCDINFEDSNEEKVTTHWKADDSKGKTKNQE